MDQNLAAEKLIHMDLTGEKDDIYAIGWCLATLTEEDYSKNIAHNISETNNLKITLSHNLKTFKFVQKEFYTKTYNLIDSLINTWTHIITQQTAVSQNNQHQPYQTYQLLENQKGENSTNYQALLDDQHHQLEPRGKYSQIIYTKSQLVGVWALPDNIRDAH